MEEDLVFRNEEKDVEVYYHDNEAIVVHNDSVLHFNMNDRFDVECFCKLFNELNSKT